MKRKPIFLAAWQGAHWVVAAASGGEVELVELAADATDPAAAAAQQLRQMGYSGSHLCLALPSNMIYPAQIDTASLPHKKRRTAMHFRLEEQLPLDAELLTADFLPPLEDRCLGVAVESVRVRQLLDGLDAAGLAVGLIAPTALLAAQYAAHTCAADCDYLLAARPGEVDLFRLGRHQGKTTAISWDSSAPDGRQLALAIRADLLRLPAGEGKAKVCLIGQFAPALRDDLQREPALELTTPEPRAVEAAAALGVEAVFRGRYASWANLRRDGLAGKNVWAVSGASARWCMGLALALLACLSAIFLTRSFLYAHQQELYEQNQIEVFRQLYPHGRVPANIVSRLRSESTRLAAISGGEARAPQQVSALTLLRDFTAAIPADTRYRFGQIRLNGGEIYLEGQARQHTDAQGLSQALTAAGFVMDPPHTESLDKGGVGFVLMGKPAVGCQGMTSPAKEAKP
jgi:type II secretory pathway component PulL